MLLSLIGFLLVGRLIIYALQEFPFKKLRFLRNFFKEGKFLAQLFACDFCLGFYLYAGLAFLLKMDFIKDMFCIYIPIFNELATGLMASFTMHLLRIGWTTKFGNIVITE